jgi:predicted GIY-YIG superfamily endonuclease
MAKKTEPRVEHASLTCNKCLETKPVNSFHVCKGRTSGRQNSCKICTNKMTAEYRKRTNHAYWRHKQGTPYTVYIIKNPLSEVYVGYTGSRPNIRFAKHKASYKHKKCKLVKLHASFDKYGIDNHTFEVVEQVATRVDAMARETVLILQYRAQGKDLNTTLSTFRVGQYNRYTGELIKEWETVTEASNYFGKYRQYIYAAATKPNRRGHAIGYLWKVLPFKDGSYYDFKTNTFTPAIENK